MDPIPYAGARSDGDAELFGDFRYLYPIDILGVSLFVPEDNSVLRALQFVEIKESAVRLRWGDYCWNDTDGCCEILYREEAGGPELTGRACVVRVRPGMQITRLPSGGRLCTPGA